jgi:recombination protein RecA
MDTKQINDAIVRAAVESIYKQYKDERIITSLDEESIGPVPAIPTGSIWLDESLGIGGIPQGRITIISGENSTGKSTLCLSIVKEAQELFPDKLALYVDMEEGAFTYDYAYAIGVDLDKNKLQVVKPDYAEMGMEIIMRMISTGRISVCVWDSIAGMYTKEEGEKSAEENSSMAGVARLMSQNLRKLASKCGKTGTALIFVNQIRTNMSRNMTWLDIPGGKAQKFYSSVHIELSTDKIRDFSGKVDRATITAKILKNKVAHPFRSADFDIQFGEGIMREGNVLDLGVQRGLIKCGGGGWYTFFDLEDTGEEINRTQGRDKAIDWLRDNQDYVSIIENKILGFDRDTSYEAEEITEEDIEDSLSLTVEEVKDEGLVGCENG